MPSSPAESSFLSLPAEIRLQIYNYLFEPTSNACVVNKIEKTYDFTAACKIFRVNHQIYHEARKVFRELNHFVRIRTPFQQTLDNIIQRQQVPVVLKNGRALVFTGCVLTVRVSAPELPQDFDDESWQFIIHLRDLEIFCEQWQWAQLSYGMNAHLTLTLELDAPHTPAYETKQVPKKLQQELLRPFGLVKELQKTTLAGKVTAYGSIEKEMREQQGMPYKSVESCLKESTQKRAEGMAEMKAHRYDAALQLFFDSFRAIHILVNDDERQFLADAYYANAMLTEEPYKNKHGQQERMMMRIRLVASICEALVKMDEYKRCTKWGMRSICMIREGYGLVAEEENGFPEREAIPGMPEPLEMANVYRFTARAQARLGDIRQARWLYRVARAYAPQLAREIGEESELECISRA